jgi:hypothetical protein
MAQPEELAKQLRRLLNDKQNAALQRAAAKPVALQLPKYELPKFEIPPSFREAIAKAARLIKEERERGLPDNWQELSAEEVGQVMALMEELGTSLVWIPQAETIRRLLRSRAHSPARRLLGFEKPILGDLEACLRQLSRPELRDIRHCLKRALDAHREGNPEAAQALAASVLTAAIHDYFDPPRFGGLRKKAGGVDPMRAALREVRSTTIIVRVGASIQKFEPGKDPIPRNFNRHASAHSVSPEQFTSANSLAGLMLATSVAREVEQRLREIAT